MASKMGVPGVFLSRKPQAIWCLYIGLIICIHVVHIVPGVWILAQVV